MTTTVSSFRGTITLPPSVRDYFAALAEVGTIVGVSENFNAGATVYVTATDEAEAIRMSRALVQGLGSRGLTPAFPARHIGGDWVRVPTYRWELDTPIYAGNGQWALLVPATADLGYLLGVITGMGSWDRNFKGEPVLGVTFDPHDDADLRDILSEVETELSAWFGESVRVTR